jgi:hypothetical protein
MPGKNTFLSEAQVTSIERNGFWLLTNEGEFFISFEDYSEFQKATVAQIHNFHAASDHFSWPDLDVDIELEALKHPERYPLKYKP